MNRQLNSTVMVHYSYLVQILDVLVAVCQVGGVVDGVVLGRGPPSVTGTVTCPDNKTRIRVYLRKLRYRGSSLGQGYWGLRRTTVTCMLVVVGEVD